MLKEYTSRMALQKVAKFLDITVKDAKFFLEVDLMGSCTPRRKYSFNAGDQKLQNKAHEILNSCGWDISDGVLFQIDIR